MHPYGWPKMVATQQLRKVDAPWVYYDGEATVYIVRVYSDGEATVYIVRVYYDGEVTGTRTLGIERWRWHSSAVAARRTESGVPLNHHSRYRYGNNGHSLAPSWVDDDDDDNGHGD